jgi:hypothetical protein
MTILQALIPKVLNAALQVHAKHVYSTSRKDTALKKKKNLLWNTVERFEKSQ